MTIDDFVKAFALEFDETPIDVFTPETEFKSLDEWNSLTALSIISMVDENLGKTITGADLRSHSSIADLYNYVMTL